MKEKIEKLLARLEAENLDAIMVESEFNRTYVTGFTGTSGLALVSKFGCVFITDFRYTEQAADQIKGFEIVQHTGPIYQELEKQVVNLGIKTIGVEKNLVTYGTFTNLQNVLSCEIVPVQGIIEDLRLIKSPSEIKIIKEATEIADAAFSHILGFIQPGKTELEVSNELEFFMRKLGAKCSSFDTIVASGLRSALPHGVATSKVIESSEMVTLDFGAYYKGYCSDITRTVSVGKPSSEMENIYNIVLEAQLRGVNGIRPGMTGKEADALTRDYITEKGYGPQFGHSTGHGLGMEVHEQPSLSFKSDQVLQPGMIVTVEPGIYVAGTGGVRIEDDILITDTGVEILTKSSKELIIL